ncbi:hypothetical protein RINTHM_2460 [Richelia intracellularis HM01]|nr:hypothetical protein RINTHM_2460 [Richelia intracellularis HM01]
MGGIPAIEPNPTQSKGLQFLKRQKGGFFRRKFHFTGGITSH